MIGRIVVAVATLLLTAGGTSAFAGERLAIDNDMRPQRRLTSHPAEDYMGALSPDGRLLVFVSDRSGAPNLWVKTISTPEIPTPRRLTESPAGDKSPAFSSDGRSLVYVSYGTDAEGDLYLLSLPAVSALAAGTLPTPQRLTVSDSADRSPVFTPDGRSVIFTSALKPAGAENLWRYEIRTGDLTRLTIDGGASPSVSPDGRSIVYVRRPSPGVSELWLYDVADETSRRLTEGPLDTYPVFTSPGKITYVGYVEDTDGDQTLTIDDKPALYRIDLTRPEAGPTPLTPHDRYALFPAAGEDGRTIYTVVDGERTDLFMIEREGGLPSTGAQEADVARAEKFDVYYADNPAYRALAWRVAAVSGDDPTLTSRSLYELARLARSRGDVRLARLTYGKVTAEPYAGYAAAALARLTAATPIGAVRRIGAVREKATDRRVKGRALIEEAGALGEAGRPVEALDRLRNVADTFADLTALAAEGALARDDIYAMTGDAAGRIGALVDLLRRFPDQAPWSGEAEKRLLDLAEKESDDRAAAARSLTGLADRYPDLPGLAAAANNRVAARFAAVGEFESARLTYELTQRQWPKERRAVEEAAFGLAAVYVKEERYEEGLAIYRDVARGAAIRRDRFFAARSLYLEQGLAKGAWEVSNGDVRVGLKTYRRLVEYDPSLVEAHRGIVAARVWLGETREVIAEYRERLRERPREAATRYALGLALTYADPPDIDRAIALVREALAADEENRWFHQTMGWLYERRAADTGDIVWAERALAEYYYGLALADEGGDGAADLWQNIGTVSYRLGDCVAVRDAFAHREGLNVPFATAAVEALFHQRWGECAFRGGDDATAIDRFDRALALVGDDPARRLELIERKGLALQTVGRFAEGADTFEIALALRERLFPGKGLTVTYRNVANNRYQAAHVGDRVDVAPLREALRWYLKAEESLAAYRPSLVDRKGEGLVNLTLRAGAGGAKVGEGFSADDEAKLIYHHIGRIYGELGRYDLAAVYYEKKLAKVPDGLPLLQNAPILTEKGLTLNQLGVWLVRAGKEDQGAARLIESMEVCRELVNVTCLVAGADALTKEAVRRRQASAWETEGVAAVEAALALVEAGEGGDAEDLAAVYNRLGQIYHRRLAAALDRPPVSPAERGLALVDAGTAANLATVAYRKGAALFAGATGPAAMRGLLTTRLNMAALMDVTEGSGQALRREVYDEAVRLDLPEIGWRAAALATLADDPGDDWAKEAARLLSAAPIGSVGTDRIGDDIELARFVYDRLAAADGANVPLLLERGGLAEAKLSLARLATDDRIDPGRRPALAALRDLARRREPLVALTLVDAADAKNDRRLWREEYQATIDTLAVDDPFVAWLADPSRFTLAQGMAGLTAGQEVVRIHEGVAHIVTAADVSRVPAAGNFVETYLAAAVDRPVTLVMADPFAAPLPPSDGIVATAPGLAFAAAANTRRTADLYRLTVAGPTEPALADVGRRFAETRRLVGAEAEAAMADAGGVVFTRPPTGGADPLSLAFPVSMAGGAPASVSLADLVTGAAGGALLATPTISGPASRTGLFAAFLLAGFPTIVVDPSPGMVYTAGLLPLVVDAAPGEAALVARLETGRPGRLVGAVGFTADERRRWAAAHFAEKGEAAFVAMKAGEWKRAATALDDALRYAAAAGIDRHDAILYRALAAARHEAGEAAAAVDAQRRLIGLTGGSAKAEALVGLGSLLMRIDGGADEAAAAFEEGIALHRRRGDADRLAHALYQYGYAMEADARYATALAAFTGAADIQRRRGRPDRLGEGLLKVGRVHLLRFNDYPKAVVAYDEAIVAFEKGGDRRGGIAARLDKGLAFSDAGDLREAETILRDGLRRAEEAGLDDVAAEATLRLANVAWYAGAYQEAVDLAETAADRFERLGLSGGVAQAKNTLGLVAWSVNDYPKAQRYLTEGMTAAARVGAENDVASALNNLGLVARSRGRLDEALDYFVRARAVDRRMKSDWGMAYAARNIALVHLMAGKPAAALPEARRAVELTTKIGDRVNGAKATLALADVLAAVGDEGAAAAFDKAIAAGKEGGIPEVTWRGLAGSARWAATHGNRAKAVALYKEGVAVVEGMRAAIRAADLKSGFLDDKQRLYEELILLLLDAGKVGEAFDYAERGRGRSFLDLMGSARVTLKEAPVQQVYLRAQDLKRRIASLARRHPITDAERIAVDRERSAAAAEFEKAVADIRRDHPDLLPFVTVDPVRSDALLTTLGNEAALVSYVATENELVIFTAAGGRLTADRRPIGRAKLTTLVAAFGRRIQAGVPLGDEPAALGEILLAPVWSKLTGYEIIGLVPHGPLHYLSFAPLTVGGAPLVERAALFYVPSASVFVRSAGLRGAPVGAATPTLALGDPDTGDRALALPMAKLEADSIGWTFDTATTLTGADATESALIERARNYRIVHVASHGLYDEAAPLDSALLLAPDGERDGRLTAAEVFSASLAAELVTLSACQTGLGEVSRGDEVVGLNRAFLYAGARTVMTTLWRVDDMASALLVKHFYRSLIATDKAKALRAAQLTVRARYPHPAYWAGFALTGDWR